MNWKEETKKYHRKIETAKNCYTLFKKRNPQWGKLYEFAERNGFFTAPASTQYHGCFKGGNLVHSIYVAETLISLCSRGKFFYEASLASFNEDDLWFIGFFHDLCKIDQYIFNLNGTISWNNKSNPAHARKSIDIIEKMGIELNPRIKNAILYHMGPYERKDYNLVELEQAQKEDPLVLYTHFADIFATRYKI